MNFEKQKAQFPSKEICHKNIDLVANKLGLYKNLGTNIQITYNTIK